MGPLAGANYDGGSHGGSEEQDSGATPVEATAKSNDALYRTMETLRRWLRDLNGWSCSDEARPRQRPWRSSGEASPQRRKANLAYQRNGCGCCYERRIEQREVKLWARLIEEWGGGELRRARRSVATTMASA